MKKKLRERKFGFLPFRAVLAVAMAASTDGFRFFSERNERKERFSLRGVALYPGSRERPLPRWFSFLCLETK
ncbi:MAG: hypothetical protein LIP00_06815, partial [Parabacteroides sp.]|nr:hypothetical protein [Parabacteroides sp.]